MFERRRDGGHDQRTVRRVAVAPALAVAVAAAASAGAATDGASAPRVGDAFSEHWDGVWRLTGTPRGVIRITQEGRTITARYTSGCEGTLTGQAKGLDGEIMTGRHKDDCCATRRGEFFAKLTATTSCSRALSTRRSAS